MKILQGVKIPQGVSKWRLGAFNLALVAEDGRPVTQLLPVWSVRDMWVTERGRPSIPTHSSTPIGAPSHMSLLADDHTGTLTIKGQSESGVSSDLDLVNGTLEWSVDDPDGAANVTTLDAVATVVPTGPAEPPKAPVVLQATYTAPNGTVSMFSDAVQIVVGGVEAITGEFTSEETTPDVP